MAQYFDIYPNFEASPTFLRSFDYSITSTYNKNNYTLNRSYIRKKIFSSSKMKRLSSSLKKENLSSSRKNEKFSFSYKGEELSSSLEKEKVK